MAIKGLRLCARLLLSSTVLASCGETHSTTMGKMPSFARPSDQEVILNKDWDRELLFHGRTHGGESVSLRSWGDRLKLYVGGEYQFVSPSHSGLIEAYSLHNSIELYPDGGTRIQSAPKAVRLSIDRVWVQRTDGPSPLVSLEFTLKDRQGAPVFEGELHERPWNHEFTVASYNVENFFDQKYDPRNGHYLDYRVYPSPKGYHSNWAEPVRYEGHKTSLSQVKARGIRRVLQGIEPRGPAFVALQEIESQAALDLLVKEVSDLGYTHSVFTSWEKGKQTAIGLAALSKFPIRSVKNITVPRPPGFKKGLGPNHLRPVLRVTIEPEAGRRLTIYGNHWSSKRGPESLRAAYGVAVAKDISQLLESDSTADYVVTGDLNCEYNEDEVIQERHNDTKGKTGINTYLKAQGDEQVVIDGSSEHRYNLHYELPLEQRRTAWYSRHGWNSFDQMVIGSQMYDTVGYSYRDNSFTAPHPLSHSLGFLFNERKYPLRWIKRRKKGNKKTIHRPGGYSDHLPISMRVVRAATSP